MFYRAYLRMNLCIGTGTGELFFSFLFLYISIRLYLLRILYYMFPDPNIYGHGARYLSVFFSYTVPVSLYLFSYLILYLIVFSFVSYTVCFHFAFPRLFCLFSLLWVGYVFLPYGRSTVPLA